MLINSMGNIAQQCDMREEGLPVEAELRCRNFLTQYGNKLLQFRWRF
jgi:hypothetical protein